MKNLILFWTVLTLVLAVKNAEASALYGVTRDAQSLTGYSALPSDARGSMYMQYVSVNTTSWQVSYVAGMQGVIGDRYAVLAPLSTWESGNTYSSTLTDGTTIAGWASQLNPVSAGGQGFAYSRYFGISLSGNAATYLASNSYSLGIEIQNIPAGVSIYYYNNGTDDGTTTYDANAVAWTQLTSSTEIAWDGTNFGNMLHLAVVATDPSVTNFTLTYSIDVLNSDPTSTLSAVVVDRSSVTQISGTTAQTQTFDYTVVPEPSTYALIGVGAVAFALGGKRGRNLKR